MRNNDMIYAGFHPAASGTDTASRLAAFPFSGGLSSEGLREMASAAVSRRFEPGMLLLEEGAGCEALLLVERGAIRVFKRSATGREISLYKVLPGESCVLGTSCVIRGASYPAVAVVERPTEALALPAGVFRRLFETEPAVRRFVMELYASRLGNMMLLVEEVAFRRMDERLAAFLLQEAEQGPGVFRPVQMSHEQIAGRLGSAREVVSRLLQQFIEEGLVTLERRRVNVADADGLRRRSGGE